MILSKESADALARVERITTWKVPPTMTRGSKKLMEEEADADEAIAPDTQPKRKRRNTQKVKSKSCKVSTGDVAVDVNDIRRSAPGRAAIRKLMEELCQIDAEQFSSNPAFDSDGQCKVKDKGASALSLSEILDGSAAAFETMSLVLQRSKTSYIYPLIAMYLADMRMYKHIKAHK